MEFGKVDSFPTSTAIFCRHLFLLPTNTDLTVATLLTFAHRAVLATVHRRRLLPVLPRAF
jgi:hypothetical protein